MHGFLKTNVPDGVSGGAVRSRTGLTGFAIRGITALLPRQKNRLLRQKREATASLFMEIGAGKESRTLDLNLGKVALYQLSYSRIYHSRTFYNVCPRWLNCSATFRLRKKKPLNVSRIPVPLRSPTSRPPQPPRRPPPPHRSVARVCASAQLQAPCRST